MAWLKVDQNLPSHPKTIHLRALRRHRNTDETSGFMQRVWGWALDNKPDGMIGEVLPRTLAEALKVKDGAELLEQLRTTGFVCTTGCDERGLDPVAHRPGRIHDWDEMSGELARQRANEAERKRLVRAHDRGEHRSAPMPVCSKCQKVSGGQNPDISAGRPINGPLSAPASLTGPAQSSQRPPDKTRTRDPRPPDASRARAREGEKRERERERERRQDVPPTPGLSSGQGSEAEWAELNAREVLEAAEPRWRDVLQALLIGGLTPTLLRTWFMRTSLEERGDFAVVRAPNAFAAEWLTKKYRTQLARVLEVPASRVVIAVEGQTVELEPEPVDEEQPS